MMCDGDQGYAESLLDFTEAKKIKPTSKNDPCRPYGFVFCTVLGSLGNNGDELKGLFVVCSAILHPPHLGLYRTEKCRFSTELRPLWTSHPFMDSPFALFLIRWQNELTTSMNHVNAFRGNLVKNECVRLHRTQREPPSVEK